MDWIDKRIDELLADAIWLPKGLKSSAKAMLRRIAEEADDRALSRANARERDAKGKFVKGDVT